MQRLEIAHQMVKSRAGRRRKNATSGSFPVVNVSGWGLPARWRQIPSCYYSTNRLVRWTPSPATRCKTLLLKLWQETGKQVLLITHDIEEAVFMATELVLLSPGPGRVLERLPLNFARRFVAGESSRSIKSDPQFIAMREYVLSRVFEQREAFS